MLISIGIRDKNIRGRHGGTMVRMLGETKKKRYAFYLLMNGMQVICNSLRASADFEGGGMILVQVRSNKEKDGETSI